MANRTYLIYYDVTSRKAYADNNGALGAQIGNKNLPYLTFQELVDLNVQYLNSPDITDKYDLTSASSSSAAIDNDWNHWDAGTLDNAETGTPSTIEVTLTTASTPPTSGTLQLVNSSAESEVWAYTSRTGSGTSWTFTGAGALTYSYSAGDTCNVSDPPLVSASSIDDTDKATGLFVVTLDGDSQTFYNAVQGQALLRNCTFEHKILDGSANLIFNAQFKFLLRNTQQYAEAIPPAPSSDYYTKTQVDALLAGKADDGDVTASGLTMSTSRLLGRTTASTGAIEEITVGSGLTLSAGQLTATGGTGDVSKVGTPVDNQVGVWTGDGTIEGTSGFTYDGSNMQLTGDIGSTGTRITKGWFTDLQVTNAIAASITGNAATVSTITGLAPDTATTQATQPNITSAANLATVGTITSGVWTGTTIAIANGGTGQTTQQAAIDALTNVSAATNEYVLTKDTATGNAIFKASGAGATIDDTAWTGTNWTSTTNGISADKIEGSLEEVGVRYADRTSDMDHTDQGMIVKAIAPTVDENTVLLANFDGADGATTTTDSALGGSATPQTITLNNGAQLDDAQKKFGATSCLFDGVNDYGIITDSADLSFGSSDFTIEFFFRTPTTSVKRLVGKRANNASFGEWEIYTDGSGNMKFSASSTGASWDIASDVTFGSYSTDTWHHIAVVRNGSSWDGYVDGSKTNITTSASALTNNSDGINFGGDTNANYLDGWIDGLRLSDVARYTIAFTPTTTAFTPYSDTTRVYARSTKVTESGIINGWHTIPTANYTATPASTSQLTMSDTSHMAVNKGLKYTIAGTDYYGIITAVTTDTNITIAGASLSADLEALYVGDDSKVQNMTLSISGTYADGTDTDLLANDMNSYQYWDMRKAHLVEFSGVHKSADSTTQPKINIRVNGSDVSTQDSNNGIQLSTAGTRVKSSAVAISTTNYVIDPDDAITINCTVAGVAGDAADLTVQCKMILE